jgi:hypothetical protein
MLFLFHDRITNILHMYMFFQEQMMLVKLDTCSLIQN